ncbi:MAG TPA: hypothetical protein VK995_04395 [Oceanipulchritudo sp.]|nr:hypothetical protein [Oceanipulchritudo sp.]
MIDPRTEELAALYVLDVLDRQERQLFEAQLSGSPELKELVREISLGLHEPFNEVRGPARLDLLAGIHKAIGVESEPVEKASVLRMPLVPGRIRWVYVWAAAAALLLVLNLFLLMRVKGQTRGWSDNSVASVSNEDPATGVMRFSSEDAREILEARIRRLESDLLEREEMLGEVIQSQSELEEENLEVKTFNTGWQREYMRLAARILPFFQDNDRMSRFTVIEMVDAKSFQIPGKSKGFAELAGRFLTGDGNIAGAGSMEFVGPVMDASTFASEAASPSLSPASRAAAQASTPTTSEVVETTAEPTGFTVWRDDEQKGFLDLYNLPKPESGEPFLWVRASDYEPYVPVGYIPDLENGTGSFFYSVDESNFTPSEILITAEDPNQPASQPSSEVLLRGP